MIRPGDIVRIAGEPPMHAFVLATSRERADIKRGHMLVQGVCRAQTRANMRAVRTRDVVEHWRKAGRKS